MRTLSIWLLSCVLAQGALRGPAWLASMAPAPPPGGGAGAVGPPAVYAAVSNGQSTALSAGSPLSLTIDTGSQTSRLLMVFTTWYGSGASCTNINCQGTNLSFLVATNWESIGSNLIAYLVAPASGSTTVAARWNASIGEATIHAVVLTNAAQISTFGSVAATNNVATTVASITNWIASATNRLVVNFNAVNWVGSASWNAGWSLISTKSSGAGQHASAVSRMPGVPVAASPATNQCTWTGGVGWHAVLGVAVKGLTSP